MDRWAGVLRVSLAPAGPFFDVAAFLLVTTATKTLAAPSWNAVFFHGDRVEHTGDPVIERLSDPEFVAHLVASKYGAAVSNAWVVKASTHHGPFAVFKEFVPTVNSFGDPEGYDPEGFPASTTLASILRKCVDEAIQVISRSNKDASSSTSKVSSPPAQPKTAILGFSKGGTVVNQILAELSFIKPQSLRSSPNNSHNYICPISAHELLRSISELHFLDVGLNCPGAYLTDSVVIGGLADRLLANDSRLRVVVHGTPRQWLDRRRPWIAAEKDEMVRLLRDHGGGRLRAEERLYFADRTPSMKMHFEIIERMDLS